MSQPTTSPKLEELRASRATAIDSRHLSEIEDDIRREKEHLQTCPFAAAAAFHDDVANALQRPHTTSAKDLIEEIKDLRQRIRDEEDPSKALLEWTGTLWGAPS